MRFVDDSELSFCLTISSGIKRDHILTVLGMVDVLPVPQTFDDFVWETYQPGKKGLLNVFQDDEFVVTLENNGYLGVTRRTINQVANLIGPNHYVAIYHSGDNGHHYVEVQDGMILANFDPSQDEAPEIVADFFGSEFEVRQAMVKALEYRMETEVKPEWLVDRTTTYLIDYDTHDN